MDKKATHRHSGSATAEATETMDLLTGMLDNATHCGDTPAKGINRKSAEMNTQKATKQIDEAVTAAEHRIHKKVHE